VLAPSLTFDRNCQRCRLSKSCITVCNLGHGLIPSRIMIIGEAPGETEDQQGQPFVGNAGIKLDGWLEEAGIDRNDVFVCNAVSCRPVDSNGKNKTPTPTQIQACRHWLQYQIDIVQPKFLLLLGGTPLYALLNLKGIRKLRGRAIEQDGRIYLPTFHPAASFYDDKVENFIRRDFKRFAEIITFDGIPRETKLNPIIVNTWSRVQDMLQALKGVVSLDLETSGLYPWQKGASIVTLGFGTHKGEYHIPFFHSETCWTPSDLEKIVGMIDEVIDGAVLTGQSGKFDLLWMRVHFGVRWHLAFDTLLAHHLLDENDLHDLEHLASLYCRAPTWDIPLAEKQGGAPFSKIVDYHGHDLYYTRQLYFILKRELNKSPYLTRVFKLLTMPLCNLFVDIEENGCHIDTSKMQDAERFLRSQLIFDTKNKPISTKALQKHANINWASPLQVAKFLYEDLKIKCPLYTEKGAPSTSESALKQIIHPVVTDLLRFRKHKQQLTFFVDGWRPYLVQKRIHPSVNLHGTVTGRPSCQNPNFYQIPSLKTDPEGRIRALIDVPPGFDLIDADLSQIELRLIAEASGDPEMRACFANGIDIHWRTALGEIERTASYSDLIKRTASTLCGKKIADYGEAIAVCLKRGHKAAYKADPQWAQLDIRGKAKPVGFGYSFGMFWKRFIVYARDDYDMIVTPKQAQASRNAFFQTYARLEKWQERQKSLARSQGFIRSPTGRVRRLPEASSPYDSYERGEAQRMAINFPIQSFASDINFMVLLQITNEFPDRRIFCPYITVYDSILAQCRSDYTLTIARRLDEIMRRPALFDAFEIELQVPIEGEVKIGDRWGQGLPLKEWEQKNQEQQR
jgi:uracil-DNA glycosylase family 4